MFTAAKGDPSARGGWTPDETGRGSTPDSPTCISTMRLRCTEGIDVEAGHSHSPSESGAVRAAEPSSQRKKPSECESASPIPLTDSTLTRLDRYHGESGPKLRG